MRLGETVRGLGDRMRGYSDADLATARRHFNGRITEEDRERFKEERVSALQNGLDHLSTDRSGAVRVIVALHTEPLTEPTIRLIRGMKSGEVDIRLKDQAAANLRRWRKLP